MYTTEPDSLALADSEVAARSNHFRPEALLSYLDQVASEFSEEVRNRGINRSWHDYRYILRELSKLLNSIPVPLLDYLDLGSGAGVIPLVMARAGLRVTVLDTWNEYAGELRNQMGNCEQIFARFDRDSVRSIRHDLLRPPLPFPPQSFDLVTLFNVVEHLSKP